MPEYAQAKIPIRELEVVQSLHYCALMVTMHRAGNWKIAVYGRDHGVPHFHVEGPDFRCSVAIATREQIIGSVSAAVLAIAVAWAEAHESELMAQWQELNG
jgi:hypothetical protein